RRTRQSLRRDEIIVRCVWHARLRTGARRRGGRFHSRQEAMRPLEGVFVLDFSTLLPGPMASLLLAEAGAEVVKVEPLGAGENMRSYHPQWGPFSVNFALLNRGKKGIALDLKDKAAREKFQLLVDKADVIVEQF